MKILNLIGRTLFKIGNKIEDIGCRLWWYNDFVKEHKAVD